MKKIVLKVVKQCAAMEGVTAQYIEQDILPDFGSPHGPGPTELLPSGRDDRQTGSEISGPRRLWGG